MLSGRECYNEGQSVVEYILLLAVLGTISISILGSSRFKDFMGSDSAFFLALKKYQEYSYRHGSPGYDDVSTTDSGGLHELYINPSSPKGRSTRFFMPLSKYPD